MDKSKKSEILKLCLIVIAALLIVTPLLPSSLRPTYLYLVFNLLIITLGAEAGLLNFFSKSAQDKKPPPEVVAVPKPVVASSHDKEQGSTKGSPEKPKINVGGVKVHNKVKKCPSTPSLFFIGGGDQTQAQELLQDVGDLSGQHLYTKAETFIGNFYNQLKMQREESWKTIHGLYHKAF
uniref:Putative LIM and calponin domains-containing protein 1 n=1 Tax=Davidia involucrata TaxID=16924 RepID=A0A5B7CCC4_DAVIN